MHEETNYIRSLEKLKTKTKILTKKRRINQRSYKISREEAKINQEINKTKQQQYENEKQQNFRNICEATVKPNAKINKQIIIKE